MSDKYWTDCSKEERRQVREWCLAQTGAVRAYKNGEISKRKYTAFKKRLLKVLDWIEIEYEEECDELQGILQRHEVL